jgi:hypothetical protein
MSGTWLIITYARIVGMRLAGKTIADVSAGPLAYSGWPLLSLASSAVRDGGIIDRIAGGHSGQRWKIYRGKI